MTANTFNCILLIDDDKITNFIHHRLLKKLNLSDTIVLVESGEEGLQFIETYSKEHNQCAPELIFLDVNMPGMKGFEFLKFFQEKHIKNRNDVKVMVISASYNDLDKERIEQYKMPYLIKPLNIEKIKQVLTDKLVQ